MTSYFSVMFLVFFLPICLIIYMIFPQKFRKYWLLIASWGFFWMISGKLLLVLILSCFSMHYFGLWLGRLHEKRDLALKEADKTQRKEIRRRFQSTGKKILLLAVVVHIGTLLLFKYLSFFTGNINSLLSLVHIPLQILVPQYAIPIGISFFTLQALSYIFDVERETVQPDENPFRLALFLSFFPQIVEGPICRYSQTADSLWNVGKIEFDQLVLGGQRILYGLMKKVVVADRLNPLIKQVFDHYGEYQGDVVAFAAVCYTVQLYMDFSGTMDAVIGVAQIFGVTLPENFRHPFFSRTISEFWQRWHITLGTWFKDYIFYPVTMSRKMKNLTSSARKKLGNHFGPLVAGSIALFCVWICNGLWHGSGWNYIFFGMYHFVLILTGNIISPAVKWTNQKLHIHSEQFWYRFLQILRSCVLVVIGEMFFRANGLKNGLSMFGRMVTDFRFFSMNSKLLADLGVDAADLVIVAVTLCIVFTVSLIGERGVDIRLGLKKRNRVIRWAIFYALILYIIIFGAYGPGYVPVDPIYANF